MCIRLNIISFNGFKALSHIVNKEIGKMIVSNLISIIDISKNRSRHANQGLGRGGREKSCSNAS
jgi:hypothetical protein